MWFVLILGNDGLPIPYSYKARTAGEIANHFSSGVPVANYIHTIMAKPLGSSPSFCLLIFGTNGKYTAEDVSKRWNSVTEHLNKVGITTIALASDSDPRYNASMRRNSQLGVSSTSIIKKEWFKCGDDLAPPFYYQDTIHILTKMRNFFLSTKVNGSRQLPFGNKWCITISHLERLYEKGNKHEHGLTKTILNPIDRQNFFSAKCMCAKKVTDALKSIPNSKATVKYLEIMRDVMDAFMEESLSPKERLRKIWYSLFLVRLWRKFINTSKKWELKTNFLTANCYSCLELNAHSLVKTILYLKTSNNEKFFMPTQYNSQSCEDFYRQIRSFSSMFSTVTNCSTKEAISRAKKIQLQSDIALTNKEFKFPRANRNEISNFNLHNLPTEEEIIEIIEECKARAINDAINFMLLKKKVIDIPCEICPYKPKLKNVRNQFSSMKISDPVQKIISFDHIQFKNYANSLNGKKLEETGPYVEIMQRNKRLIVKKTYLCHILSKDWNKLSSDRLFRVRDNYANFFSKKINPVQKIKMAQKYRKHRMQGKYKKSFPKY